MILHLQYVGRFFHSVYSQGRGAFWSYRATVNFILNNKHKELDLISFTLRTEDMINTVSAVLKEKM
jgi:hypothetical protein